MFLKSCIKVSPYALVNCKAAPNNIEKPKKMANLGSLNNLKAFSPNESVNDLLVAFAESGGHLGKLNEYKPRAKATADAM